MAKTLVKKLGSRRRAQALQKARNEAVISLLNRWLADESGYDERVWPIVKKAIEENRTSYRKRFRDEAPPPGQWPTWKNRAPTAQS